MHRLLMAIAPEQPIIIACILAKLNYLKKFTILYQGPNIWNSFPVTIASLSSFPNFKKKTARVLSKTIVFLKHYLCKHVVMYEVTSIISLVVSRGHLAMHWNVMYILIVDKKRYINRILNIDSNNWTRSVDASNVEWP